MLRGAFPSVPQCSYLLVWQCSLWLENLNFVNETMMTLLCVLRKTETYFCQNIPRNGSGKATWPLLVLRWRMSLASLQKLSWPQGLCTAPIWRIYQCIGVHNLWGQRIQPNCPENKGKSKKMLVIFLWLYRDLNRQTPTPMCGLLTSRRWRASRSWQGGLIGAISGMQVSLDSQWLVNCLHSPPFCNIFQCCLKGGSISWPLFELHSNPVWLVSLKSPCKIASLTWESDLPPILVWLVTNCSTVAYRNGLNMVKIKTLFSEVAQSSHSVQYWLRHSWQRDLCLAKAYAAQRVVVPEHSSSYQNETLLFSEVPQHSNSV